MNETARMLAETTSRLLAGQGRPDDGDATALLASLREAGLDLALTPEDSGGVGCGLGEAAEIVRAWGMHAAPLPIVELLLTPRLAHLAGRPELARTATIAQPGRAVAQEGAKLRAVLEAPLFPGCESVLALRPGSGLALLPCEGETFHDLAGNAWIRMDIAGTTGETLPLTDEVAENVTTAASLLTAVLISGAMDHVIATMIEHANTRSQFGRPIGKFQAVQHLIADASAQATVTRVALQSALDDADKDSLSIMDQLAAKAQAGRAATLVAAAAHQLFGAIGFTEEHELHHFTKRLWWWRDDWGRQCDCEARLGALAASAGSDGLWPAIVGE